jgi:hypothetical protein
LTTEEIQARNMALLAEIAVEKKEDEFKGRKEVLSTIVLEQMAINRLLKQRGLETEVRKQHLRRKARIQAKQVETRKKRDDCDIQLKQRTEIWMKRGEDEKRVWRGIEDTIFTDYNVSMSAYHGGDMEGPSAQRLMGDAKKIFPNIADYIKNHIREQEDSSVVDLAPSHVAGDEGIDAVCKDHGVLFVLLDAIFSLLDTPQGKVTEDVLEQLKSLLSFILTEYNRLGLSFTPKFRVLLNHSLCQLHRMKGFHDMGEDRIERSHQDRM